MNKTDIIKDIHKILSHCIMRSHSYNRRSRGFISELKFQKKCVQENIDYYDGGWLFFKGTALALDKKANYITISFDGFERYKEIYTLLKECPQINRLFFLKLKERSDWNQTKDIPLGSESIKYIVPAFEAYEFKNGDFVPSTLHEFMNEYVDKGARYYNSEGKDIEMLNYFNEYDEKDLISIYANRFLIDILMKYKIYSAPMDFDGIIKENGKYVIIETKEKDPGPSNRGTNTAEWFFGWDTIRFSWYLYLRHTTQFLCYSVIMEINDQTTRQFKRWLKLEILDFCKNVSWNNAITGGVGMGVGAGSTVIAPYDAFEEF